MFKIVFYADYEALEFDNLKAINKGIYPYYLDSSFSTTSLCPIFFSCCNDKGTLVYNMNAFKSNVSFIKFMDNITKKYRHLPKEQRNFTINFHNIKYDFRIIVYELFYNEFIHCMDSDKMIYKGDYNEKTEKSFSIIGQNLSKFIGVNINYKGCVFKIRDTMSIINSSQDKILKTFGFDTKVEVPWQNINIDNVDIYMELITNRCQYDVISLSKAIEQFKNTFKEKFKGQGGTASSMSIDAFKYYLCDLQKIDKIDNAIKNDVFRMSYPIIDDYESQQISLGCYSGGICTVNENHAQKILKNLQMVDINSSYPYSMTFSLPYGEPIQLDNFCDDGYNEYVIYIEFKSKGIPFIRCHSETRARGLLNLEPSEQIYTRSQFPKKFKGYLCLNSIDLDLLLKYYKVYTIEFKKGKHYRTNKLISNFVKPVYELKKHSQGTYKQAIKLLLNSLYGKFAQDLSGEIFSYNDVNDYNKIFAIDTEPLYKPLASAVTAQSRKTLIDVMYLLGDDFVYCDTDSLYFKNIDVNMEKLKDLNLIDDNELGKWAYEYDKVNKGKFLSKKNYLIEIEKNDGTIYNKLTCVGLSAKYHHQINFDNFKLNSDPFEIFKMVNIYGGKAMRKTSFVIKERFIT